jgi:hypothetical protein
VYAAPFNTTEGSGQYGANDEPSAMACRWDDPNLWIVPGCP